MDPCCGKKARTDRIRQYGAGSEQIVRIEKELSLSMNNVLKNIFSLDSQVNCCAPCM